MPGNKYLLQNVKMERNNWNKLIKKKQKKHCTKRQ